MARVVSLRTPLQSRAVRTRAALFAAARVEFSKRGYESTTALSIAARAGVSSGTFYQYFLDKDAVLREIVAERYAAVASAAADALESASSEVAHAGIEAPALLQEARRHFDVIVRAVAALHSEDPGLHAVMTQRRHCDLQLDAMTSHAEAALVHRFAALLERFQHRADSEALAFVLFGMVEGTVHAHVLGKPMVSDERLFRTLVNALLRLALPVDTETAAAKPAALRRREPQQALHRLRNVPDIRKVVSDGRSRKVPPSPSKQ